MTLPQVHSLFRARNAAAILLFRGPRARPRQGPRDQPQPLLAVEIRGVGWIVGGSVGGREFVGETAGCFGPCWRLGPGPSRARGCCRQYRRRRRPVCVLGLSIGCVSKCRRAMRAMR